MNLNDIAEKRQEKRNKEHIYKVTEDPKKPKFYILDMFPYPSGAGLHVGHPKGYIATDVIARKKTLQGFNVLHPMGFDTFGLGTEQYAIDKKMKPQVVAKENIDNFKRQLKMFGLTYDRERSFSTADPDYYKRTQRIFLQLYNHYYDEKLKKAMPIKNLKGTPEQIDSQRLAYVDYKPINRCPKCMTGLANEDLDNGKCERCGSLVEQRPMEQRVLRITKYAERLLEGLDTLKWDEAMKDLERNRIGKSEGTQFRMNIVDSKDLSFEVYTTRIDTVYGMSFVVMAPEHELVDKITTKEYKKQVETCKEAAKHKSQLERTELQKDKSGQFTGAYAINPFNNEKVPIFIADYVLAGYGTGVVMAVPAHDERDFEFAKKYKLPVKCVIENVHYIEEGEDIDALYKKTNQKIFDKLPETLTRKGILVDSGEFTGLESDKAIEKMQKRLEKKGIGGKQINYKMQDRVFSRQRYRGEPFPIVRVNNPTLQDGGSAQGGVKKKALLIHGFEGNSQGNRLPRLEQQLQANGYEVFNQTLPNPSHPDFKESMKFLKTYFDQLGEKDVLVGHSLGGKFALKLLEKAKQKIGTTILVASTTNMPRDHENIKNSEDRKGSDYEAFKSIRELPLDLKKIDKHSINKILLLSKDDPFTDINTSKSLSDNRQTIIFDHKGHFQDKEDKDILNIIIQNSGSETQNSKAIPLSESDLPLLLPDVENYEPTGTTEGPLTNIKDRVNITLPDGTKAKRETNTMPGRAGSSRYRLRYMDPKNSKALVSPEREKYRGSVDVYVGGAEHVTRHMIYARFWQKFLYDLGVVTHEEPFKEYHYVGLIMAEDGRKMSKRRGNTIDPDKVIHEFGHDTFRVYEMFMGPFEQAIARSTNGVKGAKKFLEKIIALQSKLGDATISNETATLLHQTIKKITDDIDGFKFNTCISQLMILVNHLTDLPTIDKKTFEILTILISPFAPHLAEELRSQLGNEFSIFTKAKRPTYDEKLLTSSSIKIGVQFNGKVRGDITISKDATQDDVMAIVKADKKLKSRLTGEPKKIIYIPGKILNIVI